MRITTSSNENLILGLTAFLVFIFACFFFSFQTNEQTVSQSEQGQINYEMAKVKPAESLYSLDNREIDRENSELEDTKNTEQKNVKVLSTKTVPPVSNTKKTAEKSKTTLAKEAQRKKQNNNPQAAAKKAAELKAKNTFEVQDVKVDLKNENEESNRQSNLNIQSRDVSNSNQETNSPNKQKKSEIQKNIKSIAEWVKEIQGTEDRQIVLKFVAAYKNKQVSEADFYSVISQLLTSATESKKGFALYALRATTSSESYTVLVKNQSSLNTAYQSYVQDTLLSYNQSGSLIFLKQALTSNDKQIILKTIEIVKVGFSNVKNGTTTALVENRYRRDSDFGSFAVQNYQLFLPQLMTLQNESQQSGDQDIYIAAQQLTQSIQSNSTVALNMVN